MVELNNNAPSNLSILTVINTFAVLGKNSVGLIVLYILVYTVPEEFLV